MQCLLPLLQCLPGGSPNRIEAEKAMRVKQLLVVIHRVHATDSSLSVVRALQNRVTGRGMMAGRRQATNGRSKALEARVEMILGRAEMTKEATTVIQDLVAMDKTVHLRLVLLTKQGVDQVAEEEDT
jgi:hypothetical protein